MAPMLDEPANQNARTRSTEPEIIRADQLEAFELRAYCVRYIWRVSKVE